MRSRRLRRRRRARQRRRTGEIVLIAVFSLFVSVLAVVVWTLIGLIIAAVL